MNRPTGGQPFVWRPVDWVNKPQEGGGVKRMEAGERSSVFVRHPPFACPLACPVRLCDCLRQVRRCSSQTLQKTTARRPAAPLFAGASKSPLTRTRPQNRLTFARTIAVALTVRQIWASLGLAYLSAFRFAHT